MENVREFLSKRDDWKILDVGTGVGNFVFLLESVLSGYEQIVGIDTSLGAINAATKNFEGKDRIHFKQMDASKLDFEDESFDLVCLSNSLHHLLHPQTIFDEMVRVLKKGGFLLVNEMRADALSESQLSHLYVHHFSAKLDRMMNMVHDETYPKDEIVRLVQEYSRLPIETVFELDFGPSDAMDPQGIESMKTTLDRLVARVPEDKRTWEIEEEARKIKEYVSVNGISGATQILCILKKK